MDKIPKNIDFVVFDQRKISIIIIMDLPEILKSSADELDVLDSEFQRLDYANRAYFKSLNEMLKNQNDCFKEIKHQKYRLSQINDQLKRYDLYFMN